MNQRITHVLLGLVVLGLVILAVLGPQFLPHFSKLHNVFDSPLNMGLVAVLVVLIAMFDVKLGVAFAFLVLMFAVYLMDEKNTRKLENFFASVGVVEGKQEFAPPRVASITLKATETFDNPTPNNLASNSNTTTSTTGNTEMSTTTTTSSFVPSTTPYPTKSKPSTTTMVNTMPLVDHTNAILKAAADTAMNKSPACATPQQYDFLTQQAPNDFRINDYDVAGCRYDLSSRPQNLTVYGPPLAWCATYDQQQAAKCGTLFYPLNG